MIALDAIEFLIVFAGHVGVWCILFSQIHATSLPRKLRKLVEKIVFAVMVIIPLLLALQFLGLYPEQAWMRPYRFFCLVVLMGLSLRWGFRKFTAQKPAGLREGEFQLVDLGDRIEEPKYIGFQAQLLKRFPGNQTLQLSIEKRDLVLEAWPVEMDGLVIAHLSDLHYTGKVTRQYFEKLCQECNACLPDFIFLTGDIIDNPDCLAWLPETLGKLECRHQKYFILGNHDLRVRDETKLVRAMEACGFQRALPSWQPIVFAGQTFYLAGDELPWFQGAENLPKPKTAPAILLTHTPDRIYRASELGVDLVLAGHCHGGQICLPLIGPIVAPSIYGVRFAGGTYQVRQTLLHVSRGISGDDPIRWNCPPELNVMRLRSPQSQM